MQRRKLGQTDLELPILSFGASSERAEFRDVTLDEVFASVRVALDLGMNFIDTSPFYCRGMSEVFLGVALKGVPRDSYHICTKLGRYDVDHFDFSTRRIFQAPIVARLSESCPSTAPPSPVPQPSLQTNLHSIARRAIPLSKR